MIKSNKSKILFIIEFILSIPIIYFAYVYVAIINKAGYMSIPLFYALFFSLIIIIERGIYLRKIKKNMTVLLKKIDPLIDENKIDEIENLCNEYPSPIASIIKSAIEYKDYAEPKIKEVIEDIASFEIHNLNSNLDYLSMIAKISPLMGLLGTVIGLLHSFNQMVKLSGNVSAAVFAGGISEALLTTVFGLVIAIPVLVVHQHFIIKIKNIINEMEKSANLILMEIKNN
jgi:biopolymer transport protein ExbB